MEAVGRWHANDMVVCLACLPLPSPTSVYVLTRLPLQPPLHLLLQQQRNACLLTPPPPLPSPPLLPKLQHTTTVPALHCWVTSTLLLLLARELQLRVVSVSQQRATATTTAALA